MEAVVSEMFVLKQIKEVIELRETWLRQHNLPMNYQIRDKRGRKKFLVWAKIKFHAEEHQLELQEEDFKQGGTAKVSDGKNSRWIGELERRLGTAALWHMVKMRRWLPEPIMASLVRVAEVVSATTVCFLDR